MWLGTYESDYSRTRVLAAGLRELGVGVVECHRPLWELVRHKAGGFLSPRRLPLTASKFAAAWASLLVEQRRVLNVDAIVAGYPAQPDATLASLCARARRVPLVVDAMISLTDTLSGDRARVGSTARRPLEWLDRTAVNRADLVITDTGVHARYFTDLYGLEPERIGIVPVGAEPQLFPRAAEQRGARRALFYGKLSPLHGLDTILAAARMPGVPPVRLIGDGQLGSWLEGELGRDRPPGLERESWVPYESLGRELASSAICLGIFGSSEKAQRVVPNKVYQAMAVGRAIVTADTPAAREVLAHGRDALLVPAGDAEALADAMRRLAADPELRARVGANAHHRFMELGTPVMVAGRLLDSLSRLDDRASTP
jgi:glycosyltransferase involved in cell wall biosynthesis